MLSENVDKETLLSDSLQNLLAYTEGYQEAEKGEGDTWCGTRVMVEAVVRWMQRTVAMFDPEQLECVLEPQNCKQKSNPCGICDPFCILPRPRTQHDGHLGCRPTSGRRSHRGSYFQSGIPRGQPGRPSFLWWGPGRGGGGGIGWEHTDCHEQVQMARGPRHCSLEQGMCGLLCAVARTAVTVTSHSRHSLSSTGQAE